MQTSPMVPGQPENPDRISWEPTVRGELARRRGDGASMFSVRLRGIGFDTGAVRQIIEIARAGGVRAGYVPSGEGGAPSHMMLFDTSGPLHRSPGLVWDQDGLRVRQLTSGA